MRRILRIAILGAALITAGCGSSSSSSSSSSPGGGGGRYPAAAAPKSTSAPAASANKVQVALKNIAFDPSTVNAKVGQTIVWTNQDGVDHNVTADSGATFKSSDFGQGGTFSTKVTKAGTITYRCTIHPGMTGTIVVKAAT
jgi:plastocyanin